MFDNETLEKVLIDLPARNITLFGSDGSQKIIGNNDVNQFMSMVVYIKQNAPDGIVEYASL